MDRKLKRANKRRAWPSRACRPRRTRGRCSMCGRSAEKHGVVFAATRQEEGSNLPENLRALCAECNVGRESCRELQEPEWMHAVMAHRSVHMRLGETLKAFRGRPVPAETLKLVADQDGWKTRLRELRYLGWDIEAFNRKLKGGRVSSFYRLKKSKPWPPDPTGTIRQYERDRAQRNKSAK
jgi:hypothetical protein